MSEGTGALCLPAVPMISEYGQALSVGRAALGAKAEKIVAWQQLGPWTSFISCHKVPVMCIMLIADGLEQ